MNEVMLVFTLAFPAKQDRWFGADKLKHFLASGAIQTAHYSVLRVAGAGQGEALAVGAAMTLGVGLAKEWSDGHGMSGFSWKDMTWNALGTGTASLLLARTPD